MKRVASPFVVRALVAAGLAPAALAGINEPFNYPDGPLTVVSGGAWQLWDVGPPATGDAQMVSGRARINGTTDVIRTFPNELQAIGSTAAFSFDVNITQANTAGDYTVFFSPATFPFTTGQNYANSLGFTFDWTTGAGGNSSVGVWPGGGTITQLTTITPGVVHTISGTLTKNATTISYSMQVDGGAPFTGTSNHTDALGINAFEMYEQTGSLDNNFSLDNLVLTPEPASLTLLALGGLAALRRR